MDPVPRFRCAGSLSLFFPPLPLHSFFLGCLCCRVFVCVLDRFAAAHPHQASIVARPRLLSPSGSLGWLAGWTRSPLHHRTGQAAASCSWTSPALHLSVPPQVGSPRHRHRQRLLAAPGSTAPAVATQDSLIHSSAPRFQARLPARDRIPRGPCSNWSLNCFRTDTAAANPTRRHSHFTRHAHQPHPAQHPCSRSAHHFKITSQQGIRPAFRRLSRLCRHGLGSPIRLQSKRKAVEEDDYPASTSRGAGSSMSEGIRGSPQRHPSIGTR